MLGRTRCRWRWVSGVLDVRGRPESGGKHETLAFDASGLFLIRAGWLIESKRSRETRLGPDAIELIQPAHVFISTVDARGFPTCAPRAGGGSVSTRPGDDHFPIQRNGCFNRRKYPAREGRTFFGLLRAGSPQ